VLEMRSAGWNAVEDCRIICVYVYSYRVFPYEKHIKDT
jgi:hypothetical protein